MSHNHGSDSGSASGSSSAHADRMDASQMNMAFFTSTHTPLYTNAWTPHSAGVYAGTCIFLVLLAMLFRALLAYKHMLEARWHQNALRRRYVVVADRLPEAEQIKLDAASETAVLTTNGVAEGVRVLQSPARTVQPWRFSVDLPRALLVTWIVATGYLL